MNFPSILDYLLQLSLKKNALSSQSCCSSCIYSSTLLKCFFLCETFLDFPRPKDFVTSALVFVYRSDSLLDSGKQRSCGEEVGLIVHLQMNSFQNRRALNVCSLKRQTQLRTISRTSGISPVADVRIIYKPGRRVLQSFGPDDGKLWQAADQKPSQSKMKL